MSSSSGDDITIHQVAPNGAVNELSLYEDVNAFLGEFQYVGKEITEASR